MILDNELNNAELNHQIENIKVISFSDLRSDWYVSNSAMPRFVRKAVESTERIVFKDFPRQWIPIFEWYGLEWYDSKEPHFYIPFFSDLSEKEIKKIIQRSKQERSLRILVESASMYDSIIVDFLYIVDNTIKKCSIPMRMEMEEISQLTSKSSRKRSLLLNGWQSYGRPSIRTLEIEIAKIQPKSRIAVALPCSLKRPYNRSRTHHIIYNILKAHGFQLDILHRVVITSLGVLPEEVWTLPQVMNYDAGVPDIYRILRLARAYFCQAKYECVLDCLQFEPYSDVLRIVHREGMIKKLNRIDVPRKRHFFLRGFANSFLNHL